MSRVSAEQVRSLIVSRLHTSIVEAGFDPDALDDDFDMLTAGVIDSLGLVELVAAIEREFAMTLDLADLDPESLTMLGPLSRCIAEQALPPANGRQFQKLSGSRTDRRIA